MPDNRIADFHNDILTASGRIEMLSRETVCCVCALFRGNRSFAQLRSIVLRFNKEKRRNLFLGLEDIGYFTPETAEEIRAWNPVYASLTWNGANQLAGGCMDDGGLTPKGKFAVRFLAECGICIDCAHLNRKSFAEVLECGRCRVVDSHTCMSGICRHPRNLEDWQAQEIVSRGGLIGIAFVAGFLREDGSASAEDVYRHIDYCVQKFGVGSICIGSDFNGTDDLPQGVHGYADLPRLRERLLLAGYSDSSVDRIFSENLRAFLSNHN